MLNYPFSYFSSIIGWRKPFINRYRLSWFQILFTSLFLISLTLIPIALQNQQLKNYPITTFVEQVFEPLTDEALTELQKVEIKNQQLSYTGSHSQIKSQAGQVLLGHQDQVTPHDGLTLYFDTDALHIIKQETNLLITYDTINQEILKNKDSLTQAISKDWFQQYRPIISLILILLSGGLLAINFLIIVLGSSVFLYFSKRSHLFSLSNFKECLNFILNCLGLPTLLATLLGLFGQTITTMITTQNILFVLYLVIIFYKTHFRDQD
ncbi:Maltodextrose utilization protein MalA [Streptococcus sp. DD10]|uniref:DUF1189 family protein n=1 Tax=Streptococcus sp. DD10 TaxID=1777878 RepID=UPI000792442C|nr:DUF1189 family protein [Streptococcus sp. DD10]KXT74350.1 Maltodextrose utilization protein MalA [Streptococcus sp. DD10]